MTTTTITYLPPPKDYIPQEVRVTTVVYEIALVILCYVNPTIFWAVSAVTVCYQIIYFTLLVHSTDLSRHLTLHDWTFNACTVMLVVGLILGCQGMASLYRLYGSVRNLQRMNSLNHLAKAFFTITPGIALYVMANAFWDQSNSIQFNLKRDLQNYFDAISEIPTETKKIKEWVIAIHLNQSTSFCSPRTNFNKVLDRIAKASPKNQVDELPIEVKVTISHARLETLKKVPSPEEENFREWKEMMEWFKQIDQAQLRDFGYQCFTLAYNSDENNLTDFHAFNWVALERCCYDIASRPDDEKTPAYLSWSERIFKTLPPNFQVNLGKYLKYLGERGLSMERFPESMKAVILIDKISSR